MDVHEYWNEEFRKALPALIEGDVENYPEWMLDPLYGVRWQEELDPPVWLDDGGITVRKIVSVVCDAANRNGVIVTRKFILGPRRVREVARCRQIIALLAVEYRPDLTTSIIGRLLKRDRTTIDYIIRNRQTILHERRYKEIYDEAKKLIEAEG